MGSLLSIALTQTIAAQNAEGPSIQEFGAMLAAPVGQNGVTAKWTEFYDRQDFAEAMPYLGSSAVLSIIPQPYEEWRESNILGRGPVEGYVDLSRQRGAMAAGQFSEIYQFPNYDDLTKMGKASGTHDFIFEGLSGAQDNLGYESQQLVGCNVVYVIYNGKPYCIRSCSDANDIGEAFSFRK